MGGDKIVFQEKGQYYHCPWKNSSQILSAYPYPPPFSKLLFSDPSLGGVFFISLVALLLACSLSDLFVEAASKAMWVENQMQIIREEPGETQTKKSPSLCIHLGNAGRPTLAQSGVQETPQGHVGNWGQSLLMLPLCLLN